MLKIIKILGNRKAGFILMQLSVFCLILGSIVMNFNPEIYPPFFRFNLNYFFSPLKVIHFWLYLLIAVFFLVGGSMFFSTIESIISLIQSKKIDVEADVDSKMVIKTRRRRLSAVFAHLATILALVAHLHEGFSGEAKQVQVSSPGISEMKMIALPGIGSMRINSMKTLKHPDGSTMDIQVNAEFKLKDGSLIKKKISYNSPAMFNFWIKVVLLQSGRSMPYIMVIEDVVDKKIFHVSRNRPLLIEGGSIQFMGSFQAQNGIEVANFFWRPDKGDAKKLFMITGNFNSRHSIINIGGKSYQYNNRINANIFSGYYIYNPSIPVIILSVILMFAGLAYLRKK